MNQPAGRGTPAKSARRRSRELALQGLYEWLLNGSEAGAIEAHLQFEDAVHGRIDQPACWGLDCSLVQQRGRTLWLAQVDQ